MEGVAWAMCKSAQVVNNTQHHEIFITVTYQSEHIEFFPLPAGENIEIQRSIPVPAYAYIGDGIIYIHVRCDGLDDEIAQDVEVLWTVEVHKYTVVVNKDNKLKIIKEVI